MKTAHHVLTADALARANAVDQACDLFESSWKRGVRPQIGEFLNQYDESVRSMLLVELVKLDLYYRTAAGEAPDLHEYTSQFPQIAAELTQLAHGTDPDFDLTKTWRLPRMLERVAHYELRDHIGQGAFSSVWNAWDTKLQRTVALKLPGAPLMEPMLRDMFLHEARAAAQLDHPNIVPVHDYGEHGEGGYIAFALVDGLDLKRWLKLRRPTPREAASICLKLADALAHAHEHGVVHRDLKPANIIMDGEGRPHITDFGLAKRVDLDSTIAAPGEAVGTIPYMSPEQIHGDANVDAQSDLYSLGVLLYEMLTGNVPFTGDRRQVTYQIAHDPPKPLRKQNKAIPRDLETICLKCLAKEKRDRYPTTATLRDDLGRFLNGEPIHARRVSPAGRAWRWIRRNTLVSAALGIGGCALLSAGGMMAYTLTAPPLPEPGERMVTLTTVPEGAKVAFVPLDELTGEPLPEQIIHCEERTPLHQSLPPGNYLVEAYLDDNSGRFHEVYRRVPFEKEQGIHGGYRHLRWKVLPSSVIELPEIKIPAADVAEGMVWIDGAPAFEMGRAGATDIPLHRRSIPSFFIDATEVSVAEYRRVSKGTVPADARYIPVPEDHAICVNWHQAVSGAESLGKRLPSEAEYEYAATYGERYSIYWDRVDAKRDDEPLVEVLSEIGPVGTPAFDQLPTNPPVTGLCSNVAEWTITRFTAFYPGNALLARRQFSHPSDADLRIVRGGDSSVAEGTIADMSAEKRDSRARYGRAHSFIGPGLGFRCVRSPKPRLTPADFIVVVRD